MGSAAFRCTAKTVCTTLFTAGIMSKTTPEEAEAIARKHGGSLLYREQIILSRMQLAALIDEVRGVDAEPLCHVVGFPEAGRKVCQLRKGHEGYHQDGSVRWLGYVSAPSQPAAPVELPVVGWIRGSGLQMLKDGYAATLYVDERDSNNSMALVKLSDAQAAIAAIAAGRKV